jgi:hypothetical protein
VDSRRSRAHGSQVINPLGALPPANHSQTPRSNARSRTR